MGKQAKEDSGDVTGREFGEQNSRRNGESSVVSGELQEAPGLDCGSPEAWARRLEWSLHSPGRHVHWKPSSWSRQSAWFKQGAEAHSSVSVSQSRPSKPEDREWWRGLRLSQASAQEAGVLEPASPRCRVPRQAAPPGGLCACGLQR